jgi:glycosyltransferase involved in cell wall biosynthesis
VKILYVMDKKPDGKAGGLEHHLLDIVKVFNMKRLPVYVVFPDMDCLTLRRYDGNKMEEVLYECRKVNDHRLHDPFVEKVFNRILDELKVDIIHFQSFKTLPLSLIEAAKVRKKKVLITLHDYYFWCVTCSMLGPECCWFEADESKCWECLRKNNYQIHRGFVRDRRKYVEYLLQIVDRIIVPSSYVRDVLLNLYPTLSEDVVQNIECGIDKDLLRTNVEANPDRRKDFLHLVFLGNFLHYKGNKTFLELVAHYKNADNIKFTIIGNVFDSTLIPSQMNLNIGGRYTREKVVNILRETDPDLVLLLSNWPETFSYTLTESIAAGVPVIATDAGALRERVSREAVGFLVPVEDPVPGIIRIIENVQRHRDILVYFRERVRDARSRLKTADEMFEEHFKVYYSIR